MHFALVFCTQIFREFFISFQIKIKMREKQNAEYSLHISVVTSVAVPKKNSIVVCS